MASALEMSEAERERANRWGPKSAHIRDAFEKRAEEMETPGYEARLNFAFDLEKLALELMGRRQDRESRWIQAAQQYSGRYDADTAEQIRARPGASALFVNLTRPKTTVLRARITDVLLPEDTANWDIRSSPVPDLPEWALAEVQEELEREVARIREQQQADAEAEAAAAAPPQDPAAAGGGMMLVPPGGMPPPQGGGPAPPPAAPPPLPPPGAGDPIGPTTKQINSIEDLDLDFVFSFVKRKSDEIADRARLEMEDQLKECGYSAELYKVVHDMAKFGTGVIKGPLVEMRSYRRWAHQQDEFGNIGFARLEVQKPRPVFRHVHPWDLYPDPEATCIEDAEYTFELHRWSRKQLRMAARKMGFYRDSVRQLLQEEPRFGAIYSSFHEGLREIERGDRGGPTTRFYVWEYRGPADPAVLQRVFSEMGDAGSELSEMLGLDEDDYDVLDVPNLVCFICQGHVLLFEQDVLDTNELIYSVATLDPDESSMYGEGIPGMVEHPQRALNAAWRLTIDSGALAGIPMFIVDDSLTPNDGPYEIRAGKIWRRNSQAVTSGFPGIEVVQIRPSVAEGLEISAAARQLMNDESMIPLVAHGETSGGTQQTAHGMTLLSNAVNTTFRQIVRSFDLHITLPNIRRLYQWNRQFGPEGIDGDVVIQAVGSAVLLVRDIQASQRMTALNLVATNPELGDHVDLGELFRELCYALHLPVDRILFDREIAQIRREQRMANEAEMAQAGSQEKMQVEQLRQEGVQAVEATRQETEMERLRTQMEIAQAKIDADLAKADKKAATDERKLQMESTLKRLVGSGI